MLKKMDQAIRNGAEGGRNDQLAGCSFSLGRWWASGLITKAEAESTATSAALSMTVPMDRHEIDKTVAAGLRRGNDVGAFEPDDLKGEWRQVWREIRDHMRGLTETKNAARRESWSDGTSTTCANSIPNDWQLLGTTWPSKEQSTGSLSTWTWPELCEWITSTPTLVAIDETAKLALPLWSSVRFRDAKRAIGSVGVAGAIMIDLDSSPDSPDPIKRGDPDLDIETLRAFLRALLPGVAWLVHSSARSRARAYRWRVIIPLAKGAWSDEYKALCAQLRLRALDLGSFALEADATSWTSPARGYFVPAVGPNGYYESAVSEGEPFTGDDTAGELKELERQIEVATAALLETVEAKPEPKPDDVANLVDAQLHRTKFKLPKCDLHNAVTILALDPVYQNRFAWNAFTDRAEFDGRSLTDADVIDLRVQIDERYAVHFGAPLAHDASHHVARFRSYNPLLDYLNGLRWDERPRIQTLLPVYFGAKEAPLIERYGARWMISAVARAFVSGCKVDNVLVLHGEQGSLKSSGFKELVPNPDWFSDDLVDVQSKEGAIALLGKWIVEIAELESFRGKAQTAIKAFLSRAVDHYRPVHARETIDQPRRGVLVASTNAPTFLLDPSGSRRFWVADTGAVDVASIRRDRDQLWAEAVVAYRAGEQWYLTRDEEAERREVNEQYQVVEPWEPTILAWLETPEGQTASGGYGVTTSDVMRFALGFDASRMTRQGEMTVGDILRKSGLKRKQSTVNKIRAWRFHR